MHVIVMFLLSVYPDDDDDDETPCPQGWSEGTNTVVMDMAFCGEYE